MKLNIKVKDKILTATLIDSKTTRDFISLLPLTLTLEDYARTEKISALPKRLSTEDAPAGSDPAVGDIAYYAPWGNLAMYYSDSGYANGLVVHRREARRDRTDQGGGPRLRRAEHPRQRRLSWLHRHPDDGSLHRRHGRRAREGDCGGADRTDGQARGDRRGRSLAVLGRSCLRRWARYGHRRRPNGAVMFGAIVFAMSQPEDVDLNEILFRPTRQVL
jgi:hypothetical protein